MTPDVMAQTLPGIDAPRRKRRDPDALDPEVMLRAQARLEYQRERQARYRATGDVGYARDRTGTLAGINSAPLPPGYDHSWRDQAVCAAPEHANAMFFPGRGDSENLKAARRVCATCPVTEECLEFALLTNAEGVWGGTSEKQRRTIKRTTASE